MGIAWRTALPAMLISALALAGCGKADPTPTPTLDAGTGEPGCAADKDITASDGKGCQPHADDFVPGSTDDAWPACISDDGVYHPFDPAISTNARIAAFEEIAELLGFGQGLSPSPEAFVDARIAYTQPEGLDSRVSKREDMHYPPAPMKCGDLDDAELAKYPDRCVGPARIQPLLSTAFADGALGKDPVLNAARVEAALLWFLYVSVYKEATTCAAKAKDCDSASGYYAGNQTRDTSFGLARYVKARSPQAHDASWDAVLAVRCWRDLDNPDGEATDDALGHQALGQLDRALDRDLALILRQRVSALPCDSAWQTVKILGPVIDRAATARDPAKAKVLREQLALASFDDGFDKDLVVATLDELFPCP